MDTNQDNRSAHEIIAELNLTKEYFPHLCKWDEEYLLEVLSGLAKASGCDLRTAAVNLELDLGMM